MNFFSTWFLITWIKTWHFIASGNVKYFPHRCQPIFTSAQHKIWFPDVCLKEDRTDDLFVHLVSIFYKILKMTHVRIITASVKLKLKLRSLVRLSLVVLLNYWKHRWMYFLVRYLKLRTNYIAILTNSVWILLRVLFWHNNTTSAAMNDV